MDERHSVELQAEIKAPRERVFALLTTPRGLEAWLGGADFTPSVGARYRLGMADATAVGTVLALDAPQHVSLSFDWEDEPLGIPTVLAFDAIDHGDRTYLTLRHVGLPGGRQRELHAVLWRYWFARLVRAAAEPGPGDPS
jgi:uncharacterized protein YndB with AHSA1/START domain